MIDWLSAHGSIFVLIGFLLIFLAFGFWAYRPSHRQKFEDYGRIPLEENNNGKA